VFFQNLGKMGEIVFTYVGFEVVHHMGDWSGRAPMIEGLFVEGKDQYERAARAKNPPPLMKRFDWIGEVLEVVRGEQEVVAGRLDRSELGAIADEVPAGRLIAREDEFRRMVCPDGVARKVAVVERAEEVIYRHGMSGSEHVAGAADFETGFAADMRMI
jgi:hypothetical protein